MRHATPEPTVDKRREAWEGGANDELRTAVEADGTTPTAEQFHITDIQHWIDLSA